MNADEIREAQDQIRRKLQETQEGLDRLKLATEVCHGCGNRRKRTEALCLSCRMGLAND